LGKEKQNKKKLGQNFLHSFENDKKINVYVDENSNKEVCTPLIKNYRNKNI